MRLGLWTVCQQTCQAVNQDSHHGGALTACIAAAQMPDLSTELNVCNDT